MNTYRRQYALGTYLEQTLPWGLYSRGRAICPDGKARNLKRLSPFADTFFSIPAAVTYKGKTVAGYATLKGFDHADTQYVAFFPYTYGKNGGMFASANQNA